MADLFSGMKHHGDASVYPVNESGESAVSGIRAKKVKGEVTIV